MYGSEQPKQPAGVRFVEVFLALNRRPHSPHTRPTRPTTASPRPTTTGSQPDQTKTVSLSEEKGRDAIYRVRGT